MAEEEVVQGTPARPDQHACVENEGALKELNGLDGSWIAEAVHSCYATLDTIDAELIAKESPPLSELVELANLSSIIGNLVGAGLAQASGGVYARNKPHAYPDLLPQQQGVPPAEVKVALETNKPKGHLPKEGLHLTFRYVLGDRNGQYVRGKSNRGDTVWIWEARIGYLIEDDYSVSNTEGDSGKTAVIKTDAFLAMTRVFYVPDMYPYANVNGPYGGQGNKLF